MIRIRFYRGGTYPRVNRKKLGSFYLEFKDIFEVANFLIKKDKFLNINCYNLKEDLTPEQYKFLEGLIFRIHEYEYKIHSKVFDK